MADGDLITEDFQYEYNGLLLGANTPFETQSVDGLSSLPNVRSGSVDRFGQHGGVGGRHYLSVRRVSGTWDIYEAGQTEAEFKERRDELALAFAVRVDPTDVLPFVFQHPGRDKLRVYCRPIDRVTPTDRMFSLCYGLSSIRLEATDPFIYSNDEYTITLTGGFTSGGMDFPLSFPLEFGTGSSSGSAQATNNGTAPAPWRATLNGPASSPKITHQESGRYIELEGLDIAGGDYVVIDAQKRSILYNGTSSRRGYMSAASEWFFLDPDASNTFRYQMASGDGDVIVNWRDTYWSD